MGDFNLRTEKPVEEEKLTSLLPGFDCLINGATFQKSNHFSSLDHILISKDVIQPYYCTHFKNIYSEHSAISLRYLSLKLVKVRQQPLM